MERLRSVGRGGRAVRTLLVLAALGSCLAAVAYAASVPRPAGGSPGAGKEGAQRTTSHQPRRAGWLPRPRFTKHPEPVSTSPTASFAVRAKGRALRFECRLDGSAWMRCARHKTYRGLSVGDHDFSVRVMRGRRRGPASTYRWTLLEPKPFSIEAHVGGLADLFPGAGPVQLPVTLVNPNPVPILVTSLVVSVNADLPGCEPARNFEALPSSASPTAPLQVPAKGSVDLPGGGVSAPALGLRELPFDQDACQDAELPLLFTGEAHG